MVLKLSHNVVRIVLLRDLATFLLMDNRCALNGESTRSSRVALQGMEDAWDEGSSCFTLQESRDSATRFVVHGKVETAAVASFSLSHVIPP